MPRGSRRYLQLQSRLRTLRRNLLHFLPTGPVSSTSYTDAQLDAARAYIVLAHAEIEAYCEDAVRARCTSAKDQFDASGRVTPTLRRLLSYYVAKKQRPWSDVRAPSKDAVENALRAHLDAVDANHGIKRRNLEKLLYPVGVVDAQLGPTLLAGMESFGTVRGGIAHQSHGLTRAPDPPGAVTDVDALVAGLLQLDRVLGGLR